MISATTQTNVVIDIGGLPIRLCSEDASFLEMLQERYSGFLTSNGRAHLQFNVELQPPDAMIGHGDVTVLREPERWSIGRGDFEAQWSPRMARGVLRQSVNPYSLNTALRIIHSLLLVDRGGFLLHASSAVRNGRAFLFAGVSGAGKTTMARLAPPDVTLLTDEISYVSPGPCGYQAHGTPFAGDLGRNGENVRAPLAAVYLLAKGPKNKVEPVGAAAAARALLENVLFFSRDSELVNSVFDVICNFVGRVPIHRLTFAPDARVWEMIQ
ncbi:MAG TPA: hypothetical protein VJN93_03245 [Candidatus Acidoferrum sp.]|nr:hypothetical protein [Candidatus Acidoferrum sp.]